MKAANVTGITVTEVRGFGRQGGHVETYRGAEYKVDLIPKVRLEMVVEDAVADSIVAVLVKSAGNGKIGDGKVWITDVSRVVRIRTGEEGRDAI
ncbi:MAG: P-II family nitrogen regulator [Actinomycetota bacterium]